MLVKNFSPPACTYFGNIVCSYLIENGVPVYGMKGDTKYFKITRKLRCVLEDAPAHIKFLSRKEVSDFDKKT